MQVVQVPSALSVALGEFLSNNIAKHYTIQVRRNPRPQSCSSRPEMFTYSEAVRVPFPYVVIEEPPQHAWHVLSPLTSRQWPEISRKRRKELRADRVPTSLRL